MSKGKIIQVMGPVVDVAFEDGNLPHIQDALVVENQGKQLRDGGSPAHRRRCGPVCDAFRQRGTSP